MRSVRVGMLVLALALLAVAVAAWWAARMDHASVLQRLNASASDGDVRSYSVTLHGHIQANLRIATVFFAVLGTLLLVLHGRIVRSLVATGDGPGFIADLRAIPREFRKRTSKGHRRIVVALLLIGALIRGWMLFQPVTYDEAFTWTYYASRPWYIILSDYSYPNNHVLHTLLVKCSTGLFGVGRVPLRLPAYIAGLLALPVFYLFVRHLFNRYIALMALALVVSSGRLIEYGALARGYSITWLCFVTALLLARHSLKENSRTSALLIGVVCAIGMWAVPTMLYAALLVYLWMLLYSWFRYREQFAERAGDLLLSVGLFVLLTAVLYAPLLVVNGTGRVFHHELMPQATFATFSMAYGDAAFELWAWIVDVGYLWFALLGCVGFIFAGSISTKFRFLAAAMGLGAVPLVCMQLMVAPPRAWGYTLFIFHLSSAIALYYLLKLMHDKWWPGFNVRLRTISASSALLGLAIPALVALPQEPGRWKGPQEAARYLKRAMGPHDRVLLLYPVEATVEFEGIALGIPRDAFHRTSPLAERTFVVVAEEHGQTLQGVLLHHGLLVDRFPSMAMVHDTDGMRIFAAP